MKKILLSLLGITVVIGLVGLGVFAYFSDTETSSGNLFTAGSLDLKVDDKDDPNVVHVSFDNMKPGDTVRQYWTLKNAGTIPGQVSIEFANIVNHENTYLEPEIVAGDTTSDVGELGGFLYTLMKWRQPPGSGSWNEIMMVPHGHTFIIHLTGPYGLGENGGPSIPILGQNEEVEIELRLWWHPRADDNKAQSDNVEFDVIFNLDQS